MTNQTLRDRFNLPDTKSSIVSQIIDATLESGLIRVADERAGSRRHRSYFAILALTFILALLGSDP